MKKEQDEIFIRKEFEKFSKEQLINECFRLNKNLEDSQSEIESLREQVRVWKQHCETARNSDDLNTTLLFQQGVKNQRTRK